MAEDADRLHELFSSFGPVSVRRMFGGAGLFVDGLMFGLVFDGVVYLKAKADTVATFEREGCQPFSYGTKTGRRVLTSYWRLPDRLYDDPDELAQWARAATRAFSSEVESGSRKENASLKRVRARSDAKPVSTFAERALPTAIQSATRKSAAAKSSAPKRHPGRAKASTRKAPP